MRFLVKADDLFVGLRLSQSYHEALQVSAEKSARLQSAKVEIRAAIRDSSIRLKTEDRFWQQEYATKSARARPDVTPKFFTQGSFAYKLIVAPCYFPEQQIDLDDGMYVRVDYLYGRPALVAKSLFAFVEEAVGPLCRLRGWTLDDSKDTCVRIQISDDSHIDIPIYSAPRELAESMALDTAAETIARVAKRGGKTYAKLPSDLIMLAHRDGTWQQSDPLKLHDWVENCVARYGEDFRRACRYFKGWRDYTWNRCCLASIAIMAAVAKALEQLEGGHRTLSDDKLVFEIAQRLPAIFEGELINPAVEGAGILNDWSDEERKSVVEAAESLAAKMNDALKGTLDAGLVVERLREAFGERIPFRPDRVEILPRLAAVVVSEKAATVPSPRITKSTSG